MQHREQSLMTRIVVGKTLGFAFGLFGFVTLPALWPDADPMLRWGLLLWYTTIGGIIGLTGVITWHPLLNMPLPWWLRASLVGGWFNLVLVFFAHEKMAQALAHIFGPNGLLQSPFWFVAEGILVGLIIGYTATRLGGEGRPSLDMA